MTCGEFFKYCRLPNMASWTAVFDDDEELGSSSTSLWATMTPRRRCGALKSAAGCGCGRYFPLRGGQSPGGKKEKVKEFSWAEPCVA